MNVFNYSSELWAYVITSQLATNHQDTSPEKWGYCCIAINPGLEEFIQKNYFKLDFNSGKHLQIFSLAPPPKNWILERINELRKLEATPERDFVLNQINELFDENRLALAKEELEIQRSWLLDDLREKGVETSYETDFLFFKCRKVPDGIDIDIIGARTAGLDYKNEKDMEKLFKQMSDKAKKFYSKNKSIEEFIKGMDWIFATNIAFQKITELKEKLGSIFKS